MMKKHLKNSVLGLGFCGLFTSLLSAGSFVTASKPTCSEVTLVVKGHIDYNDSMKSGEFGFHHCMHNKLHSQDFPKLNPNNNYCTQVDLEPEVVSINPPLPHEKNSLLPVFQRPNPYYIPEGAACEVKYSQYYYLR